MSRVRGKDTKPELVVRRMLHSMGFRYRLHGSKLPGRPDIVFGSRKKVIFVNGCFWHYHGCHLSSIPETRRDWWKSKLESNARRDFKSVSELQNLNWRVLIIWECGFRKPHTDRAAALGNINTRAAAFLNSKQRLLEIPRLQRARNRTEHERGGSDGK